jgi:ABC-type polysaccharide/polyol phosphate transport system ATPase subunit
MSSEIAIKVCNLSKCYQIYSQPNDRLKQFIVPKLCNLFTPLRNLFPTHHSPLIAYQGLPTYYKEFWALKDISFEVKKGETVGIIGRNGSGKSTLLQMICGTLNPTNGSIQTYGRIAALLELGSGFNPEFTGRENIYMNAAILGLSREEIDRKYDAIVAFSDIGDFVDQPVKTYSSGMYLRLAFAVVINVEPDILIVDEALAVGDMLFQAKCMIKMKQMIDSGVTVLFVSHDTATVKGLCQQCVFLEKGLLVEFGKTLNVVDEYIGRMNLEMNQFSQKQVDVQRDNELHEEIQAVEIPEYEYMNNIVVSTKSEITWPDTVHRYGDGGARILDIKLLDGMRNSINQLDVGQEFIIQVSMRFDKSLPTFAVGYSIRDLKGQMLVGAVTTGERIMMPAVTLGDVYIVEISSTNRVTAGVYTITVGLEFPVLLNKQHIFLDIVEHALVFQSNFHLDPVNLFPSMVKIPVEFGFIKVATPLF